MHELIDQYDFATNELRGQKTEIIEALRQFAPSLLWVVRAELRSGNKMASITQDWPCIGSINVGLMFPFFRIYSSPEITHQKLSDVPYAGDQYSAKYNGILHSVIGS